jgi:hypothetical protein
MQKWTFLGEIGSKSNQSFCHVHNNDSKETAHTWQDGEGFPGDGQVLEGGIMVTEEHPGGIPRRIQCESEWY